MRTFTLNEKTCWLTERQYSRLLRRFDLDNAVRYDGGYRINVPCICPACMSGIVICPGCPFKVFETSETYRTEVGCVSLLRSLGIGVSSIGWKTNRLDWFLGDDVEARRAIGQIREHLLSLKKVKKGESNGSRR